MQRASNTPPGSRNRRLNMRRTPKKRVERAAPLARLVRPSSRWNLESSELAVAIGATAKQVHRFLCNCPRIARLDRLEERRRGVPHVLAVLVPVELFGRVALRL